MLLLLLLNEHHFCVQRTQSPTKIVMWTADTFVYEILASGAMPVFTASLVKSAMSSVIHAGSDHKIYLRSEYGSY